MKAPSCGATFVRLHAGHLTLAFSRSEMVMMSSNGFLHSSHINSYLGMVILPGQSSFRRAQRRSVHLKPLLAPLARELVTWGIGFLPSCPTALGAYRCLVTSFRILARSSFNDSMRVLIAEPPVRPAQTRRGATTCPSRRGGRTSIRARPCYVRRPARHTADHGAIIGPDPP